MLPETPVEEGLNAMYSARTFMTLILVSPRPRRDSLVTCRRTYNPFVLLPNQVSNSQQVLAMVTVQGDMTST